MLAGVKRLAGAGATLFAIVILFPASPAVVAVKFTRPPTGPGDVMPTWLPLPTRLIATLKFVASVLTEPPAPTTKGAGNTKVPVLGPVLALEGPGDIDK